MSEMPVQGRDPVEVRIEARSVAYERIDDVGRFPDKLAISTGFQMPWATGSLVACVDLREQRHCRADHCSG
jgi:hypothetical protein